MPSIRRVSDSKRRSRTGCLPCRKRRRKCDEQKPECGSCMSRHVSCIYPGPTFIFDSQCGGRNSTTSGPDTKEGTSSVNSISPDSNLHFQASPGAHVERQKGLIDVIAQQSDLRGRDGSSSLPSFAGPIQQAPQTPAFEDRVDYTSPSTETQARRKPEYTPASSHPARNSNGDGAEAGLLTSFVSDIVPWIVSTCPGSRFANSLLGLAERQPAVRSAMIALVKARNKALYASNGRRDHLEEDHEGHHLDLDIVEGELGHVDDTLAANVARSLLSIARLFGSRPTSWSKVGGSYLPSTRGLEEPLRYLLQMQGKFELAFCILAEEPPSTSLVSYLEQSVSAPNSAIRTTYLACLYQLVQCLHLTYRGLAPLTMGSVEQSQGNSSAARTDAIDQAAEAWSPWHSLWAHCLHWYQARPPEMEPIFGLYSGETSAEDLASFPIEIYSTPIALQANLAIHLSFMVLIAHKPRLLKLSRSEARLGSDSWHAQKIAGMAVWNHFKEQFDPLFVVALLLAAEKMTHESQQMALLGAFRDIEREMGIVLNDEIARLEKIWRTSRYDDG